MSKSLTFWCGILGALFFIATSIIAPFQYDSYSHIKQFISESYAIDAPYGLYFRLFGFIPSGIFIMLFAWSSSHWVKNSKYTKIGLLLFGTFYGLGTIIVSIFPCDSGCNKEFIDPSVSQIIHNTTGMITYVVVPISLLLIGYSLEKKDKMRIISVSCGLLAILFSFLLTNNLNGDYIGLYQRLTEGAILFWLINFAYYVKTNLDS